MTVRHNGSLTELNSWLPSSSDDGRSVAFCSNADNLAAGPPEQQSGVFSHDRLTGITRRHSSTRSGREASDYSRRPSQTADGAYVVFESGAANLVPGDGSAAQDVFIARGPDMLRRLRVRQAGRQLAGP